MNVDYNNPRFVEQLKDTPPKVRKAFYKRLCAGICRGPWESGRVRRLNSTLQSKEQSGETRLDAAVGMAWLSRLSV